MSLTVFLAGHGEWDPENGFTQVPRGCSVAFYTHHAKTLLTNAAYQVVDGTYGGEPENVIGEYKQVPNMTQIGFVAAENAIRTDFTNHHIANPNPVTRLLLLPPGMRVNLSQLFILLDDVVRTAIVQHGGIDFVWCCCRYVLMKGEIRGRDGFNATEDLIADRYIFRDRVANMILGIHPRE
ncbi:putative adhesin [Thiocystis violascens]|uniref:Putative adhesin Stv domain-containing protein n=1 Tax=Thiocystis violascens (strain ATCC 17096 / DSM 198 / 6111) TaxID=765911 RepID=I3YB61_THIV6|nr:hypothetical protein [Thiocystis violascens]AFL74229.1 hypothetical protein Thivi_2282 [Thiocystis violascens DSM 198]